jgi:hypothetical protein
MGARKGNVMFGATDSNTSQTFIFNHTRVVGQGKPTLVSRGVAQGFSLPIYDDDDEELFCCHCIDNCWDGVTNPILYIGGWLDTANTDKSFRLQVSWEKIQSGQVVGDVVDDDVKLETFTGTASQYQFFKIPFPLDLIGSGVVGGDAVAIRIRRIAATRDEISGEFVVQGAVMQLPFNKIGQE